jgi:hypothetical protein
VHALRIALVFASQVLQRMLDELGLDTPGKLRAFVTKRSLPVLGLSLLESVRISFLL